MTAADIPAPFASVDEAVGALLDDELADAAAEVGVPVDQLEADVRALPDFATIVAALAGARQALSTPEPLTQIARFRLMTRATSAVTPARGEHKGRKAGLIAAAAAAVVVVLLGSAALVSSLGGGGSDSGSSASNDSSAAGGRDFGDLSNAQSLRNKVEDGRPSTASGVPESAPASGADPAGPEFDRCRTALSGEGFRSPVALGTGTFDGRAALVYQTTADNRRVVLVVDAGTCTLLSAQSF